MGQDLRTFLSEIIKAYPADVITVEKEVDPKLGITAYVEKFENQKLNPVLFFPKVKNTKIPVVTNVHSSFDRLALSIQTKVKPEAVLEFGNRADHPIAPTVLKTGKVKEVVLTGDKAQVSLLPQIVHNEMDGGPYICSAGTILRDPETGVHNVGIYRNQIKGNRIGLMMNPTAHGSYVMGLYKDMKKPMEVAIVVGHHPAFLLSAGGARLPGIGGEFELTGGLLKEPLELVKGETIDMLYPANAEIVIEGVIDDVSVIEQEGNFGEYPRYYSGEKTVPFIRVTGICMRHDAIYQDVMAAHDEHIVMGSLPRMATYLQRTKANAAYVTMVNLPKSASSRAAMYISIKKRNDGEGKQAGLAGLASDPNIKMVVVVDDDIDVFDEEQVWWAVAFRCEMDRSLVLIPNTIGAHLNPSSYAVDRSKHGVMNTRVLIDATWPIRSFEKVPRANGSKELLAQVSQNDWKKGAADELLSRLQSTN